MNAYHKWALYDRGRDDSGDSSLNGATVQYMVSLSTVYLPHIGFYRTRSGYARGGTRVCLEISDDRIRNTLWFLRVVALMNLTFTEIYPCIDRAKLRSDGWG